MAELSGGRARHDFPCTRKSSGASCSPNGIDRNKSTISSLTAPAAGWLNTSGLWPLVRKRERPRSRSPQTPFTTPNQIVASVSAGKLDDFCQPVPGGAQSVPAERLSESCLGWCMSKRRDPGPRARVGPRLRRSDARFRSGQLEKARRLLEGSPPVRPHRPRTSGQAQVRLGIASPTGTSAANANRRLPPAPSRSRGVTRVLPPVLPARTTSTGGQPSGTTRGPRPARKAEHVDFRRTAVLLRFLRGPTRRSPSTSLACWASSPGILNGDRQPSGSAWRPAAHAPDPIRNFALYFNLPPLTRLGE